MSAEDVALGYKNLLEAERSFRTMKSTLYLRPVYQDAQIKLSGVISDLFGRSGRAMLDALVAGERNPRALAELTQGSLVNKKAALTEALTGQFEDHHASLLRVLLGTVDHLTAQIDELDRLIAQTWKRSPPHTTARREPAPNRPLTR